MEHYLTTNAKNALARLLATGSSGGLNLRFFDRMYYKFIYPGAGYPWGSYIEPITPMYAQSNEILSTYVSGEFEDQWEIVGFETSQNGVDYYDDGYTPLQTMPLPVDKRPENPMGAYSLTIIKRDVIL